MIDFKKLYEEEKALSKQKLSLKVSSITNTYNMMQDMRHLIILDFRQEEEFKESHIRKSLTVTTDIYQQILAERLGGPKEMQQPYKSHFEGDDLKRILCVLPNANWKELEAQINKNLPAFNDEVLLKAFNTRIHKAYFLKDFNEVKTKYPFLCVGQTSPERSLIKAEARYPSEIK